jgi:sugar O-acyltransferase (sialic acid O-acetyltransferase NeuD family)
LEKVVIFGVGQIADVAHFYLAHDSPHQVAAFTVDPEFVTAGSHRGLPVAPFDELPARYPPDEFLLLVPVSYRNVNRVREAKYRQAKQAGYRFISYVSSRAVTWPGLCIGENCFILEQNVIQPFAQIGNNVILWSGNHIGHHSTIGDHCFLASHVVVSGNVTIGQRCFVGVNATIRNGIRIADDCVIGAGSLILRDTAERAVYNGAPARLLPTRSDALQDL